MEFQIYHGLNTDYFAEVTGQKESNNGKKTVMFWEKSHNRKKFICSVDLTPHLAFLLLNKEEEKIIKKYLPKDERKEIQSLLGEKNAF